MPDRVPFSPDGPPPHSAPDTSPVTDPTTDNIDAEADLHGAAEQISAEFAEQVRDAEHEVATKRLRAQSNVKLLSMRMRARDKARPGRLDSSA